MVYDNTVTIFTTKQWIYFIVHVEIKHSASGISIVFKNTLLFT